MHLLHVVEGPEPALRTAGGSDRSMPPSKRTISSPEGTPKHVFVVGLHRSGTSILAELIKAHPLVSGHTVTEMPPELENEGQHVQVRHTGPHWLLLRAHRNE